MKKMIKMCILISLSIQLGCASYQYLGNNSSGFKKIQDKTISVEKAIKIATPYIEKNFNRILLRKNWPTEDEYPPKIHVMEKGDYFYISKININVKVLNQLAAYSVRVNKYTGEVLDKEGYAK